MMTSAIITRLALAVSCVASLNGDRIVQDHRPASRGSLPRLSALPPAAQVRLSWWTRGGEPGPGNSSDKLDLSVSGGRVSGTYTRARFDPGYDPPFKPEEFSGDVPMAMWEALRAAIDGEQILDRHFPAEDKADLADAMKDTVEVSVNGRTVSKTLYDLSARDLPYTQAQVKNVAGYLAAHGQYRLLRTPAGDR